MKMSIGGGSGSIGSRTSKPFLCGICTSSRTRSGEVVVESAVLPVGGRREHAADSWVHHAAELRTVHQVDDELGLPVGGDVVSGAPPEVPVEIVGALTRIRQQRVVGLV